MDNFDSINSVEDLLKAQMQSDNKSEYEELTDAQKEAVGLVTDLIKKDWYIQVLITRGLIGNLSEVFKEIAAKVVGEDPRASIDLLYDAAQMDIAHGIMRGVGDDED